MERRNGNHGDAKKTDIPENMGESDLYYNVEDTPPIGVTLFFGFQIALANICFNILHALIIQDLLCADEKFATTMYSSITFMAGVGTIIQSYFGVRLPVFQGPSLVWFLPFLNAKTDPKWGCVNNTAPTDISIGETNMTTASVVNNGPAWETEWSKIAGSMMVAECVQMLLAATGLISLIGQLLRPITICVFFILLGFFLHGLISDFCEVHWGIAAMSIVLIVIFSQYIHWIQVPLPTWTPKKGLSVTRMPLFQLFPVVFAVLISWAICAIITAAKGFPEEDNDIRYQTRTDIHSATIDDAPIFIFPHPGQFITEINFSLEYFIMFLVPVLSTVIESMGDYCQFAMASCLPRPPAHAMNRGIFVEGLVGFFSALMGMGIATTSYSQIAGIIRITKVASRQVYLVAGILLIILSVFGKAGAVFITIPKPVVAGPVFIAIALLVGGTFMNLTEVDVRSSRNQTTLGCGLMVGVFVPLYFQEHDKAIDTGSDIANGIIVSLITTSFLVGTFVAAFLDNTLPGRSGEKKIKLSEEADATTMPEENGTIELGEIGAKKQGKRFRTHDEMMKVYELPYISKYTRRWKCSRFVPMLPNPYPEDKQETGPTSTNL